MTGNTDEQFEGTGSEVEERDELAEARETNRALLQRLRESLCASEPAIDPALIHGDTLEEVEASFAAARATVQRVRQEVVRAAAGVPAGAPGRALARPLSAIEKIRSGLEKAVR